MGWGMVIDEKASWVWNSWKRKVWDPVRGGEIVASPGALGGGGGSGQLKAAGFAAVITRQITRGG